MKNDSTANIIRFAESFGIKVEIGNSSNSYTYFPLKKEKYKSAMCVISVDAITLIEMKDKKIFTEIIESGTAHELGHFLIASSKRKYKKNYGIPKENRVDSVFWGDRKYWDVDEAKANFIQNEILLHFKCARGESYKYFINRYFGLDHLKTGEKDCGALWAERTYIRLDKWWKEEAKKKLHHIFRIYHSQEKLATKENPILGKMASRNWKV